MLLRVSSDAVARSCRVACATAALQKITTGLSDLIFFCIYFFTNIISILPVWWYQGAEVYSYVFGSCTALDRLFTIIKLDWSDGKIILLKVSMQCIVLFYITYGTTGRR